MNAPKPNALFLALLAALTLLGASRSVEAQQPPAEANAHADGEGGAAPSNPTEEVKEDREGTREEVDEGGPDEGPHEGAVEVLSEPDGGGPVLDGEADAAEVAPDKVGRIGDVVVTPEHVAKLGGSGHVIDKELLEKFDYDDPHAILSQVPGVYVRQEDAFGLRPNIGLRGANSDRSKKVTLMEDGVLLAPAPYSAPAAYYFPLMSQMQGVEVYKGPASIVYGPNTIGGAINLVTRDVPWLTRGEVDMSGGSFLLGKADGYVGAGDHVIGGMLQAAHLQSDGFKELDNGGDTGFSKSEFLVKGRLNSSPSGEVFHRLDLKLGFAREASNETYLGLSDADFRDNPLRRYSASALGEMEWWRTQARLSHTFEWGNALTVETVLYRHDFSRAWRRLNGFADGPSLEDVLADPESGARNLFYRVLTGQDDSVGGSDALMIGTNNRSYVSQGAQTIGVWRFEGRSFANDLEIGIRVHYDEIQRNHTEEDFLMQAGALVSVGGGMATLVKNTGDTVAVAAHALDNFTLFDLTVSPGVRVEVIRSSLRDELGDAPSADNSYAVVIPGLGLYYGLTDELGVLAGVHRGFSPVSPGQPEEVEPELSVNYELGARYVANGGATHLELVGFFNDYDNLTGECSFSSGCAVDQLDQQFNAGQVHVMGLESVVAHRFPVYGSLEVPVRVAYTLTDTEFQTGFASANPQFGEVEIGDELPYVPKQQASVQVGIESRSWGLNIGTTFVDAMREEAGQGTPDPGLATDRYAFVDAVASARPWRFVEVYVKGDNIFNSQPIVSRRPFGARPGKPLLVQGGVKMRF